MTVIIDRRHEPDRYKFGKDRARFLRRIRESVQKSIQEKVTDGSIKDFEKGGVKVPIPKKTTQQPVVTHTQGPSFSKVFPGNLYDVGDVIPIPPAGGGDGGKGAGSDASDGEDDQDDFVWLSEDEFLGIFFDGRSLPDMRKISDIGNSVLTRRRSGHTTRGPSHKMDMDITNAKRKNEALVLKKTTGRRILHNLLEQYEIYRTFTNDLPELNLTGQSEHQKLETLQEILASPRSQFTIADKSVIFKNPSLNILFHCVSTLKQQDTNILANNPEKQKRIEILEERLEEQTKARSKSANFQSRHLTYHFDDDKPQPITKAVMICKMDVSGSMGKEEKNTAKAFFWVLNKFLESNYEEVDVVFISHTTTAEETNEQEFFYGQRSGGTQVSSCLEKELEIIAERYPVSDWNIYSAQASDGDNQTKDNEIVLELMQKILPMQQASYFIEVLHPYFPERKPSDLYNIYDELSKEQPHLKIARALKPSDSLAAFKEFFPVAGSSTNYTPEME